MELASPDEEELAMRRAVQLAAQGDPSSLRSVLTAVSPRVMSACRRVLGSHHPDLDDATQESLMGLVRCLGAFRGESSFGHYATCIAVRTCLGLRRTHARRGRLAQTVPEETTSLPSAAAEPDSVVVQRQREVLRDLLASLSPVLAEALTMRILLGLSFAEVADATGVPLNTVRSRVRLAKENLRQLVQNDPVALDLLKEEP